MNFDLETQDFLTSLKRHPALKIQQRFEIAEMFGFETRNKYAIESETGESIAFAAEQNKSILGHLARHFLGHWRSFDIHVFGPDKKPKLRVHHPFRFIFQRLEMYLASGEFVGALEQRFALFSKKFDVQGPRGEVLLEMRSPIWKIWTFPFRRANGEEVARVEKKWTGLLAEAFTDKDRFFIRYHDQAVSPVTDEERLLVLASGMFIDLQYFEKKGGD